MLLTVVMLAVIVLSYVMMLGLVKFAGRIIDKEPAPRLRGEAPPSTEGERKLSLEPLEGASRS